MARTLATSLLLAAIAAVAGGRAVAQVPPASPPPPAPGQFSVNEAASERALERVLVEQGALLLPAGTFELEPAFTYQRTETSVPSVVAGAVASTELRQNNYIEELDLRAGLPWDSQFEIDAPYRVIDQRVLTTVGTAGLSNPGASGGGFSDIVASLSHTVLREASWWPDLVLGVQYSEDTGGGVNGVAFGTGFSQVRGIATATKRADPIAFVGSLAFAHGFSRNGFTPGNEYDATVGAVLAASPETSLRFLLQQQFFDDGRVGGTGVAGTGLTAASFVTGASVIVAPKVLLDISVGIGLTHDAPRYFIRVGLPIRFD
jgi:hypothetical protein